MSCEYNEGLIVVKFLFVWNGFMGWEWTSCAKPDNAEVLEVAVEEDIDILYNEGDEYKGTDAGVEEYRLWVLLILILLLLLPSREFIDCCLLNNSTLWA